MIRIQKSKNLIIWIFCGYKYRPSNWVTSFLYIIFFILIKIDFLCQIMVLIYSSSQDKSKMQKKKNKITHIKIVIFIIILYAKLLLLTNIYSRDNFLENLLTLKLQWIY